MTSAALPAQVWDAGIAAETPVLLNRPIFYTGLPVSSYGDARWSLAAARFGQHLLGHAAIN
jgi:hypothetical protein